MKLHNLPAPRSLFTRLVDICLPHKRLRLTSLIVVLELIDPINLLLTGEVGEASYVCSVGDNPIDRSSPVPPASEACLRLRQSSGSPPSGPVACMPGRLWW